MSQQINLFNRALLKKRNPFSLQMLMVILLLVVVILGGWIWHLTDQVSIVMKEGAALKAKMTEAQDQLAKANVEAVPREKSKALQLEIETAEAEYEKVQKVFEILEKGDFGNTDGYSDYFRAFARQIGENIWLTGVNIRGANEIGLKGRALKPEAVPAYISSLAKEPVLKGKSFSTLEMSIPKEKDSESKDGAASNSAAPRKPSVGFIEFNLQSANSAGDKSGEQGAK